MPKKRAVILSAIIELLYHSTLFYDNIIKFKNHNHEMSIMKFIASSSLINLAFEAISSDILKISDSNKNTIVQILSKYTGRDGLFGGYFLELECNYNKKLSKHQLTRIHKLKISSLFLATVACITALNDTNSKEIIALNSYANNLGLIISMSTNHRHNNDAQVNLLASQAVDILKIFPPSDKILLLESFINYHKDKCIKNKSSM
jgi:geranylgeranyl pyrophosphate synthase